MREIDTLIVHCSATPPDMDVGVAEIDRWHKDRGWDECGYHIIIRRSGEIEYGRNIEKQGAHAYGHNAGSVGVCMIGGVNTHNVPDANFSFKQYKALISVIDDFRECDVIGHRDVSDKACPSFDVHSFLQG